MPSETNSSLVYNRATATWIVLVAATLVSFAVGAEHGSGALSVPLVLAITMIKVRLVGLDFMGLRRAPIPLRAVFEFYCAGVWAALSSLYVFG